MLSIPIGSICFFAGASSLFPPMNFRIGCALWAYKGWIGPLFPNKARSSDLLMLYSQRFTTVEGNTTFYSVPDEKTVNRWANEVPPEFRFCPKLPKSVTHSGLLHGHIPEAIAFLERMQGLGDRLGPLFAQLPPSYGPSQLADLGQFLRGLPRGVADFSLEVRHPDWFKPPHAERLTDLLGELGIGRVLLDSRPIYEVPDHPSLYAERKKPRLPLQFSSPTDVILVRYISHPTLAMNDRFLKDWLPQIDRWLQTGKQLYFFVHCPMEEQSPTNARHVQTLLEQQGAPVPPLPWDTINTLSDSKPVQLSWL